MSHLRNTRILTIATRHRLLATRHLQPLVTINALGPPPQLVMIIARAHRPLQVTITARVHRSLQVAITVQVHHSLQVAITVQVHRLLQVAITVQVRHSLRVATTAQVRHSLRVATIEQDRLSHLSGAARDSLRPAARQGESVDTSTSHIGFRCVPKLQLFRERRRRDLPGRDGRRYELCWRRLFWHESAQDLARHRRRHGHRHRRFRRYVRVFRLR